MARTRTRQQMRTRARVLADAVDSTNTSDTEANDMLDAAIADLWGLLVQQDPTRHMITTTLTTTANTLSYLFSDVVPFDPNATDFMAIVGVDYVQGLERIPIHPFGFHERGVSRTTAAGLYPGASVRYDVRGQGGTGANAEIVFDRNPAGHTYEVHYVPAAPLLTSDVQAFDGVNGWEHMAELTVAIEIAMREQMDTSDLRAERERVRQQILALGAKRTLARSGQVASVWVRRRSPRRGL